ncbi:ATP-binding protein [bacterium]|nr:ATP-binding protein [bacterium]
MKTTLFDLEQKLEAQEKTIHVLAERLEQQRADNITGFALFEQNISLENVVATRTRELDAKRAELENTLAELKAAQSELLQAQKLQAIGQLAAGIAHEINTPTQYVGNNVDFLAQSFAELIGSLQSCRDLTQAEAHVDAPDLSSAIAATLDKADLAFLRDEVPRAFDECKEGIRRIASIVMAMKDFAHPSGGHMQKVDLPSLVQSTVEISRNEWKLVAELETEFDPELPPVEGLKDELGQVLLNLIVNAAQAIEDANMATGAKGLIRISGRTEEGSAVLRVEDSGCGIPPELQDKIFEPFFTTKEVGRGSGQGLAIAYSVVTDKHHGKLCVSSEPGAGTVFTIRLPLKTVTEDAVPAV